MNDIAPDELERWAAEFERQQRAGRVKLLDPLPWRTRLRLACQRRIDVAACWLVEHVSPGAGEALWRAFRMWP